MQKETGQEHGSKTDKQNRHKHGAYKFTNKVHSPKAIMSTILGLLSLVSVLLTIILTYVRRGEALLQYGTVLLLCLLFSGIGIGLGVSAKMERDKYYIFAYIGLASNVLVVAMISMILYAGAYGL